MSRSCEASWKPAPSVQHFQAALGLRRDLAVGGQREQRIGAELGAADAAAELIDLRQPEHIGAVHDQRIGGRNVEAGFDDRGGEKHVELAVIEGGHHVFQHAGRHLAVGDGNAHLRHGLVEEGLGVGEILDARADVEALAAAIALAQQRFAHHDRVEGRDKGAHREPIDRRRGDDRHLAHA
jgi:hypothetical protein